MDNGLRTNARAIPLPTPMLDVDAAMAANGTNGERCNSGTQT